MRIEKRFFFQFYFLRIEKKKIFNTSTVSSIMFLRFVFSTAARLIILHPVTAPNKILPFYLVK